MNGKLIGLLIRSNATVIEALKYANPGNGYEFHFDNLQSDCIRLAEQAEEMECDITIQQHMQVAAAEGAQQGYDKLREMFPPMVPISPAHLLEREPLHVQDITMNRIFDGTSASTGQAYRARINEIIRDDCIMGIRKNVVVVMLQVAGNNVSPFDRAIKYDTLIKEFVRWVE